MTAINPREARTRRVPSRYGIQRSLANFKIVNHVLLDLRGVRHAREHRRTLTEVIIMNIYVTPRTIPAFRLMNAIS